MGWTLTVGLQKFLLFVTILLGTIEILDLKALGFFVMVTILCIVRCLSMPLFFTLCN